MIRVTFSLPTCAPSAAASCLVGLVPCLFICSPTVFCFLIFKTFIYLFSAALGTCGLVAVSRDCSLLAVHWILIAAAFLVAEHRLWARRLQQLWLPAVEHRLNSCSAWTGLHLTPHGMWNLLESNIEPTSPALAVDALPLSHQGSPAFFFY